MSNNEEQPEYYMLYIEGKGMPNKKHLTIDAAKAEAERLCQKEQVRVDLLHCSMSCNPRIRSTDDMLEAMLDDTGKNNVSKGELIQRLAVLQTLVEDAFCILTWNSEDPADYSVGAMDYKIAQFCDEASSLVSDYAR